MLLAAVGLSAQNIRYVSTSGKNANNGMSWATAKADIQDAINDLVDNNLTGEVWVAAGTYYPTESTESSSSPYYKAFKIPAGITVRGGFRGKVTGASPYDGETSLDQRELRDDKNFGKASGPDAKTGNLDGEAGKSGWYKYRTILCGDPNQSKKAQMNWNPTKQQFDAIFYGNSYHVVWFAMNGFNASGRANGLVKPAKLEGCIVEGGHAYSNDVATEHPHIAYGGGIYMVANSFVYNCEVRNCDASRNGGGIYMDGGGIVRRTYVHDCQALGLGTEYGMGGGICEEGAASNSKANPIVVAQSVVTNCVGRLGGGVGINAEKMVGNNKYAAVINSTVVNNNTATIEGGGVYTHKGGGVASATIVNNRCNGTGVTLNGAITGRSGGLYSRDAAYVGNTVIWGNVCETNDDIQYATSRTSTQNDEKSKFYYNAVSRAEYTDWSMADRMGVLVLTDSNDSGDAQKGKGFPLFFNPTPKAGYLKTAVSPVVLEDSVNWQVSSESFLTYAGISTADLDYEGLTPAPTGKSYDMRFAEFNSRPSIGAICSQLADIAPASASVTYNDVTYTKAFFVDPSFVYEEDNTGTNGGSWNKPARFLGLVLDYIANHKAVYASEKVAVFVKEGTVDNTRVQGSTRVRETALEIPSNVTLFGSFSSKLSGTSLSQRHPVQTPTVISAKLMNEYRFNLAHLINIEDGENITIDGFKLSFANASSTELNSSIVDGAAITLKDCAKDGGGNPTIHFKNIIVSNSTADHGAAVYADNAAADFENCIFHNNATSVVPNSGIIYGTNGASLSFNHCDVLRNVGYASYLGTNGTINHWDNSIFYGNMDQPLDDTNIDRDNSDPGHPGLNSHALAAFSGNTASATGHRCMFDARSEQFKTQFNNNDTGNQWQYDLQYAFIEGTGQGYPRFINPTKNSGVTETGDQTYYGRATSFEPHNNNPIVNLASYQDANTTWGRDLTTHITRDYGGLPDIGAVESHAATAEEFLTGNANTDGQPAYGSVIYVRDFASDVPSNETIKTKNLTSDEQLKYDGSSWERAIIGNAMYDYVPGTIDASTGVGTYVKVLEQTVGGTFQGFKLSVDNSYLKVSGSNIVATTNANEATVWSASTSATGGAVSSLKAGTYYFWTQSGSTRTYLKIAATNSTGTLSYATGTTNANITIAISTGGYTLARRNRNTSPWMYIYSDNGTIKCGNTTKNNVVAATEYKTGGSTTMVDEHYDAADTKVETKVMTKEANSTVSISKELQVYFDASQLETLNSKGKQPVSYNIANFGYKNETQKDIEGTDHDVEVDGTRTYLKNNGTALQMQSEKASSSKYVLIKAGSAKLNDVVYIYDITEKKYVTYNAGTFSLVESPTDDSKWRIKQSSKDGQSTKRLNIVPASVSEDVNGVVGNTENGWQWTGSALTLANRSENTSQWVLENDQQYDVYNTNVTTANGSVKINGLQYAVNKAHNSLGLVNRQVTVTESNTQVTHTYQDLPAGKQDGQVWIAAGTYTNFSNYSSAADAEEVTKFSAAGYTADEAYNNGYGYLIRNHVKVYGGFPATGNPGMNERRPQLNKDIAMSQANQGLEVNKFETILQTQATLTATYKGTVLAQPNECAVTAHFDSNTPHSRVIYEGAEWDGFTIQNGYRFGFKNSRNGRRVGGGGALLYENVVLRNCIIRKNCMENTESGSQSRGGGVYCDGGILENCYLLENYVNCKTSNFGGGIYMIKGTMFNSVIANNKITADDPDNHQPYGAGVFLEVANFYNNTIVNNTGGYPIGIWNSLGEDAALTVYNSIIIGTEKTSTGVGKMIYRTAATIPAKFHNCYLASVGKDGTGSTRWAEKQDKVTLNDKCKVFTNVNLSSFIQNPFVKSWAEANNTTTGLDYRIDQKNDTYNCVNAATEDIGNAELPDFDMDYTERIQDCSLDIGAYEYDGAYAITPDETTNTEQAIFYVTPNGYGTSAGNNPANAACAAKLQKVIDAAGRYKYLNPNKQVIVKVANSYDLYHETSPVNFTYYATRTTDWTDQDVRIWSIIVPRGVEVWGGYTDVPVNANWENTGATWNNTNNGFYLAGKDHRNITKNPTYFDSFYVNKLEKTNANTYHVVTFTDRIYDKNGYAYTKADFAGKTKEQIHAILSTGESSTYLDILGNDETLFAHMSEPLTGYTGVAGNVIMDGTEPKNFATSGAPVYASNRAVLDGIFVSGGQADAPSNGTSATVNINSYGGAAIVTDYGYVRNCVLTGNQATNGGALALTDGALVSGSLFMENQAEDKGGAIYVFENGTNLSNGITVNSDAPDGNVKDYNMSHVITSTIVNNSAQQGGGLWFSNSDPNVRILSSVLWQNEASDQNNVYGMVNPEQPTDDETLSEEFYPFSYSVVESVRASGTNNQSTEPLNHQGVRFVNKANDIGTNDQDLNIAAADTNPDAFGYYGLTHYSILCSTGLPVSRYNELKKAIAISDVDLLGQQRIPAEDYNKFVEVGARALAKQMPNKQLMLRLFVATPKDVDTETAVKFMKLTGTSGSQEEYYSQEGSSFAYPFNSLQDALDYIKLVRDGKIKDSSSNIIGGGDAHNLPFEILVGMGTYYPTKDLNGDTKSVWGHTFAIPEGTTIIGGFNPKGGGKSDGKFSYYGRYYTPKSSISSDPGDIYANVKPIPTSVQKATSGEIGRGFESANEPEITLEGGTKVVFQQWHIEDIADRRAMNDNNKNGIVEPWEFKFPTTISGNAVNGETDGVYHVMTAVSDEDAVGHLPKVQSYYPNLTTKFAGYNATTKEGDPSSETGYQWKEMGQQIRLNGLVITGGNALTYLKTALDEYGKYIFYQGAGLQVDGNRYKNNKNNGLTGAAVFHNSAAYGVGYRDIPVSITNCQFRNNVAGYGGAISTNGSLSLFGSSFEQNLAIAQTETPDTDEEWTTMVSGTSQKVTKVMYPGQGGAILATGQLSAFNTLFANNEARLAAGEEEKIGLVLHPTFRVPDATKASATLRAAGGAIMMGSAGNHHIVNCNFVRNRANAYPAVFTMNPTTKQPDGINTHDYSQIINTVAWGNEVNPQMLEKFAGNDNYQFASKLLVNVGRKGRTTDYITNKSNRVFYSPEFDGENTPTSQSDLETEHDGNEDKDWQEAVWFCAYEAGTGFTPNNENDLRDKIVYTADKFAPTMIKAVNGGKYQNCNILITADNDDIAGPNFGRPSAKAGFDGFMEGADWSPARFNSLTDNGNGWIKQEVHPKTLKVTFNNDEGLGTGYQGAYCYTHYISDIIPGQFPEYKLWIALGNEKYMQATNDAEPSEVFINKTSLGTPQKNLPRISPDPTPGVARAYIDIGVYEYIKQPLVTPDGEVDILWVSTKEHPENGPATGATWRTPTSDLQRAINTLLSSRNGHKKEIRIMEGEYTPITTQSIDGQKYNTFVIDNKSLNKTAVVPSTYATDANQYNYYAQSLTIKGGYSRDIMYEYDPVQYKTVIRQKDAPTGISADHLFYVADPIVRYYHTSESAYTEHNDGAIFNNDSGKEYAQVKTMPIQIDGLTLINDKAKAQTQGSAIYYPAVTGTNEAHTINVNSEVTYYTKADQSVVSDTETEFLSTKIYYANEADKTAKTRQAKNIKTEFFEESGEPKGNPAKLLISKTQFVGNGAKTGENATKASAVFIGQNGGSALIYNSVFHSNTGMPLDAYNTVCVNNTFAKNGGQVRLQESASQMHNSVLWLNNNGGAQTNMSSGDAFTYNAYTGGPGTEDGNKNICLSANNAEVSDGPNFVNPASGEIEELNFDIKPSMRLLNQGQDESLTSGIGKYYAEVVAKHYDYALVSTTDKDVLYRSRLNANRIDRGAYEFQGTLSHILYVDPNKSHRNEATGANWDEAFGYGDLQNAIDLAAISTEKPAYVFVKGASSTNRGLNTNEALTLRDGVQVYGSVMSNYTNVHDMKGSDSKYVYTADGGVSFHVPTFITDMLSVREGVASHSANKTIVTAIKTSGAATYGGTNPTILDGFVVTDPATPTAPVVDVTNTSKGAVIVLRNLIVADNDLSGSENVDVVKINNGLLYEALLRDNKVAGSGSVLYLEDHVVSADNTTHGYAVNVTVDGKIYAPEANIFNSIYDNDKSIVDNHISGYFYNIEDPNLNYQLTETSKYIDDCSDANPMATVAAGKFAQFINYNTDRDLLGNPRLLRGVTSGNSGKFLDRGAFETWRVDNNFICGNGGNINGIYTGDTKYTTAAYSEIKKQFYPHDGSVVYIMKNKSLVVDPVDAVNEVKPTPHNPGYMLLQEGANFYGNGRPATCSFLAVERTVRRGGEVVAVPYAMDYNKDVAFPNVTGNVLTALEKDNGASYTYNGAARSNWEYNFADVNSPCWDALADGAKTAASNGVLYVPADNMVDNYGTNSAGVHKTTASDNDRILLRFTAKGASMVDYIYTEDADYVYKVADHDVKKNVSKSVVLHQNNDGGRDTHNNGNTDDNADFTQNEDMGWNLIGLPYLVSNYQPYNRVSTADGNVSVLASGDAGYADAPFQMHIPHTLWLYYDGVHYADGTTSANGDGGFYSVSSWDASDWHLAGGATPRIWVGEGFFTQTATFSDTESLVFYRPVAPASFSGGSSNRRYYLTEDVREVEEASDVHIIETRYYGIDGVRLAKPQHGVSIIQDIYSDGSVRNRKVTRRY